MPNDYSFERMPAVSNAIHEIPFDFLQQRVAAIRPGIKGGIIRATHNGVEFSFRSGRIKAIMDGQTCVCCGKKINHARLTTACNSITVDVGYLSERGGFTRFTVDHMLLDCLGGAYNEHNIQIMCATCNTAKSDLMSVEEIERVRKNPKLYARDHVHIPYLMYLLDMQEYEMMLRTDGITSKKAINEFHAVLAQARARMPAKNNIAVDINNPYADLLRPPSVQQQFARWFKTMPPIKELVCSWLYRNNVFIYC